MEKQKSDPTVKEGDMLAFARGSSGCCLYEHYGVADGKGNVIHFGPEGSLNKLTLSTQGKYKKEPMTQVGKNYTVKNHEHSDKKALLPHEIVKRAEDMVGKQKTYNLEKFNCETAASELRYGIGSSTQVAKATQDAKEFGRNLFDQFSFDKH